MNIAWYDLVGTTGVVMILVAYFLAQTQRVSSQSLGYSAINLVGSVLIAISLVYDFNLASFIIEIAWISISIYGIVRARRTTGIASQDL